MIESIPKNKFHLTGADAFILALENHNRQQGACGSTCRYVLELKGKFSIPDFEQKLNQHKNLQWLSSLAIYTTNFFSKPYWKETQSRKITVNTCQSDEFIPNEILSKQFLLQDSLLFSFDVVERSNGNYCLIFSWHHLLMDSYGAVLLLKNIFNEAAIKNNLHADKTTFNFQNIKQAVKAKLFIDKTSKRKLSGISASIIPKEVHQKIKLISFSKEETKRIEQNAVNLGAKFGVSPFYLACAAQTVKTILNEKKNQIDNFWIPVLQNIRKKGALGPLLGNHLSFLFYRISQNDLSSLPQSVESINHQMLQQMRAGIPKAYFILLNFLKRTPSWLYYKLIKGPKGKSLASFLFTMAEEHPAELMQVEGLQVTNAFSLPPNNFQPGLTFAFMKFDACLQLMILSYDKILTETEMQDACQQLKQNLLHAE